MSGTGRVAWEKRLNYITSTLVMHSNTQIQIHEYTNIITSLYTHHELECS